MAALSFVATCGSCLVSYAFFFGGGSLFDAANVRDGALFSAALMAILLAHEMAHYVVARLHGFALSLPWFLPFPNVFGTLGAVIRLRSLPRSRAALLEMGAAGPISGCVVAFALLWVSVPWTHPPEPLPSGAIVVIFQDPLIVRLVGLATMGAVPDPLAVYHPVTMAAWVGCFLTGLNLLPIGQLDGGHVLNALWPDRAPFVSRLGPVLMVAAGFWWSGWFFLGALLFFLSAGRPLPVEARGPLPLRARLVALVTLALFVLTFLPRPLIQTTVGAAP